MVGREWSLDLRATTRSFHSMEEKKRTFPFNGNFFTVFSTQWKLFGAFFHSMEMVAASGIASLPPSACWVIPTEVEESPAFPCA